MMVRQFNLRKQRKLVEAVKENVAKYPMNIKKALEYSAKQTGSTYAQAHYVWYGKTSKQENSGLKYSYPVFVAFTANGMVINCKNAKCTKLTKKALELDRTLSGLGESSVEDKIAFLNMIVK